MTDSTKVGLREEIACLVWIGGGGNEGAWDRMKDRAAPAADDRRPNYTDEKVAEAWATADAIMARFKMLPR